MIYYSVVNHFQNHNADFHDSLIVKVFENWFQYTSISNLPSYRKDVMIMGDAKCHRRHVEKSPTIRMRKI